MALVVEDGSLVVGANSYVSLADARAFATARGFSLPSDDAVLEPLLIKAMDYLESKRAEYKGTKVESTQALQWPRQDVYIDGFLFDYQAIPVELVSAQVQLAIEQHVNEVELNPTDDGKFITKDKTGPLETEFSARYSSKFPTITAVDRFVAVLLKRGGGFGLKSKRI